MTAILVPIFICVVLPVSIVLIIFLTSMNSDNKRAAVLIKAIEANNGIDADRLAEALSKPRRTPRELLNIRLLRGCLFTLLGVASAVVAVILATSYPGMKFENIAMPVAGVSLSIGISYLIVYFVTRRQIDNETGN